MADQDNPPAGALIVGITEDGKDIIVNHPELQADADGVGHIVFSPDQAVHLAVLLFNKANVILGLACGNCGDAVTEKTGWATARFRYCFKPECQQEFYKEAQAMIRKVNPEIADRLAAATNDMLAAATRGEIFTCPRCNRTSHNPNDARDKFCGACKKFFK